MKNTKVIAALLVSLCCAQAVWAAPKGAADKLTTEVARVNDEGVSAALFELVLKDQLQAGAQDSAALRDSIRTNLVLQTFLTQQALKQRIDKVADVQLRMEMARKSVLAVAWQQQWHLRLNVGCRCSGW